MNFRAKHAAQDSGKTSMNETVRMLVVNALNRAAGEMMVKAANAQGTSDFNSLVDAYEVLSGMADQVETEVAS